MEVCVCPNCGYQFKKRGSKRALLAIVLVFWGLIVASSVVGYLFLVGPYNKENQARQLLKKAYGKCTSGEVTIDEKNITLVVDAEDEYDVDGYMDAMQILKTLGFSDSVAAEMKNTTALMGKQNAESENFKVSWSYHPDNGLDAYFEYKK